MPTNLYGPGDNFDLANSHVLPALIRKTAEAKAGRSELVVWGTGTPAPRAALLRRPRPGLLLLMNLDEARFGSLLIEDAPPLINIGTGEDVTIRELAETVARVLGFNGSSSSTPPSPTERRAS